MASAAKRGIEAVIGKFKGADWSPGKKDSLLRDLQKEWEEEMVAAKKEVQMSQMSDDGSPSTAASSGTPGSPNKKQRRGGGGKGGGKGQGGRKYTKAPDKKLGEGDATTRLQTLESVMTLALRMLCTHANEFRRMFRETQQILKFAPESPTPKELEAEHTAWKNDIPEATDDNPFPQNENGPLRFFTFKRMATGIKTHGAARIAGLGTEEGKQVLAAAETLENLSVIRTGVLRFYQLRKPDEKTGENAGTDKVKELWTLKLSQTPNGNRLGGALAKLDQYDLLDAISAGLSQDYAPKGGLQRAIEGVLQKVTGGRKKDDKD